MHIPQTLTSLGSRQNDDGDVTRSYRHGDVLIVCAPLVQIDYTAEVARADGRIILALGEATGHAHAIEDVDAQLYGTVGTDHILRVGPYGATVEHEEHAAIVLAPGTYLVRRQREYVPGSIHSAHVSD